MKRKNKILAVACISLFMMAYLTACKKEVNNNGNTNNTWSNTESVNASISGQILDENGAPLANATVKSGTHSYTTTANGVFFFKNVQCKKNAHLITVSKTGYFEAYRTLEITAGNDHFTRIMVMRMDNPQNFASNSDANINAAGGAQVNIPANSIVYKNNNTPFNGVVTIYAKTIKSDDANIDMLTPGALRGITTSNQENALVTYGMLAVEMVDGGGSPLQIAPGKSATIRMPIPANQQATAPSEIPLWHFDTDMAMWVEDGKATRIGNEYVGTVKHFSYWNCDYGGPICEFDATFKDSISNVGLGGYKVKLISSSAGTRFSYTGANGYIAGGIPVNSTFTLELIDPVCNSTVYSTTFSSTTTNVSLGTVLVSFPSTISGTVVDCSGNTMSNTNAMVLVAFNNIIYPVMVNSNGTFIWSGHICTPTATITAYDLATGQNGSLTSAINAGTNNIGNIAACGTVIEFINVNITDATGTVTNISMVEPLATFSSTFNAQNTDLYISENITQSYKLLTMSFNGNATTGTHTIEHFNYDDSTTNSYTFIGSDPLTGCSVPITITAFSPTTGGFINGSFNGSFVNGSSSYTVTGNFGIRRDF